MRGPIRVLYVNPGVDLGGAEHSLLLLLSKLALQGVDAVVAIFGQGSFSERLQELGIPSICVPVSRVVQRASRYRTTAARVPAVVAAGMPTVVRLAMLARRVRAQVIHTNGLKAHLLGGLAGRLLRIPVVWHLRDFLPPGAAGRMFRAAIRWLPSLVIANSEAVATSLRGNGRPRHPCVTLYNPVDLDRFRPDVSGAAVRRELGLCDDTPLVGLIAHLTPWKGHELFLQIAGAVRQVIPDARFIIVGGAIYNTDGHETYAQRLVRRADDLGLSGGVSFLGARADVPEILAALDTLVHCPTSPEPFGRVLTEAMAVGRPVVAARSGGIPEVVEDGVTGLLAAPGDVDGFAEALVALLRDPACRRRLGTAASQRAERLFGVTEHASRVTQVYHRLLLV